MPSDVEAEMSGKGSEIVTGKMVGNVEVIEVGGEDETNQSNNNWKTLKNGLYTNFNILR